jgi:hypothetical protein
MNIITDISSRQDRGARLFTENEVARVAIGVLIKFNVARADDLSAKSPAAAEKLKVTSHTIPDTGCSEGKRKITKG